MNTIQLKIQFGQRKGKLLQYPALPGLRPTLARSRDVLFNWVQKLSEFTCLDAFAGTGILGIQALCLGAKHVDFIETQAPLIQCIEEHLKTMNFQSQSSLYAIPAKHTVKKLTKRYDMIFFDPPFDNVTLAQDLWDDLVNKDLIYKDCLIYLEIPKNTVLEFCHTTQLKHKQIGDVWIYLLQYS
jgi:16S rRNA (guanine966-N2)-methyltransferase